MPLKVEGVVDCGVGFEEFLGWGLGFETLLLPLSSSDWQVRVLDPIVLSQSAWPMEMDEAKVSKRRPV